MPSSPRITSSPSTLSVAISYSIALCPRRRSSNPHRLQGREGVADPSSMRHSRSTPQEQEEGSAALGLGYLKWTGTEFHSTGDEDGNGGGRRAAKERCHAQRLCKGGEILSRMLFTDLKPEVCGLWTLIKDGHYPMKTTLDKIVEMDYVLTTAIWLNSAWSTKQELSFVDYSEKQRIVGSSIWKKSHAKTNAGKIEAVLKPGVSCCVCLMLVNFE
ncbi:hypothetical protein EJB05_28933, partial [Eragrostis curvula]